MNNHHRDTTQVPQADEKPAALIWESEDWCFKGQPGNYVINRNEDPDRGIYYPVAKITPVLKFELLHSGAASLPETKMVAEHHAAGPQTPTSVQVFPVTPEGTLRLIRELHERATGDCPESELDWRAAFALLGAAWPSPESKAVRSMRRRLANVLGEALKVLKPRE